MNQWVRSPFLAAVTIGLLVVSVGLVIFRRRQSARLLRELREITGLTDEEMRKFSKEHEQEEAAAKTVKAAKEQEAAREAAYRVKARGGRFEVEVAVGEEQVFAVEGGGTLAVQPGLVKVGLEMANEDLGDGVVDFRCRTFVCDGEGLEWCAETIGRCDAWLGELQEPEGKNFREWNQAPAAWQEAMRGQCLLAEGHELLDSREYHVLEVEGRKYPYLEKYQGPEVDVAWFAAEKRWLVRVRKIFCDEDEAPDGCEVIPAFAFLVAAETGVLLTARGQHAGDKGDLWEGDENRGAKVAFRRTGRMGTAQRTVAVRGS